MIAVRQNTRRLRSLPSLTIKKAKMRVLFEAALFSKEGGSAVGGCFAYGMADCIQKDSIKLHKGLFT